MAENPNLTGMKICYRQQRVGNVCVRPTQITLSSEHFLKVTLIQVLFGKSVL